jgi:ribose transport system ATP-binding protein
MQSTALVELRNISKRFPGVQALDNVNLSVERGEIHAVIGENGAGKSTLMNILAGELQPDAGTIQFEGRPCTISNPFTSKTLGIGVVYQELALCPNLSIAENIALSSVAAMRGFAPLRKRQFGSRARAVLQRLGLADIDTATPAGELPVAQQQLVEIAKALSSEAKLLILDEPNSALTHEETAHLFTVLRQLKAEGVGIIYVSHRLEEVLGLADRITVLRDGRWIATLPAAGATVDELIARMVGREVDALYHREQAGHRGDAAIFRLAELSVGKAVHGVSLSVQAGEIVGIAGLPDSGKDELVEACYGLRRCTGALEIRGKPANLRNTTQAIAHGIAFVPADRRRAGALLTMNVRDNVAASNLPGVSTAGLLRSGAMRKLGERYVQKLDVRVSGLGQQMATLSGGNQQKVILARSMATRPQLLILQEPTRGIDVGAKAEIYRILQDFAAQGMAVLIASSELPELIGQCDRILVMYQGRITGEFRREDAAEEPILACAMGQATHFYDEPEGR